MEKTYTKEEIAKYTTIIALYSMDMSGTIKVKYDCNQVMSYFKAIIGDMQKKDSIENLNRIFDEIVFQNKN